MAITENEARQLELPIYALLSYDAKLGKAFRIKGPAPDNVAFGLDDLQFVRVVKFDSSKSTPPDKIICPQTGLPLRPLYIDVSTGLVKRAVPISWELGVDYLSLARRRSV